MSKINIKSKSKLSLNWKNEGKTVPYNSAIKIMEQTVKDIYNKSSSELIWLLEHPSIYTCGTSYKKSDILNITEVPIVETGRGGQITYHGPGQRIIYVMLNLNERNKDIKRYVKCLENWMIDSLKIILSGLPASRRANDSEELTFFDFEIYIIKSYEFTKSF